MRQVKLVRMMIASPSDVASEREALPSIVDEINRTPGIDYRIELVGWETHTYPTLYGDPQAAVNYQIGDDYDVLLGILWSRFGSPTPRYDSGTQEEFERAYQRYLSQPTSVHIALYFTRQDVPIDTDSSQLTAVNQFRDRVRNEVGAYCWDFKTTDEFSHHVRIHLRRIVSEIIDKKTSSQNVEQPASVPAVNEEDIGYIDYIELFDESMNNIRTTAHAIGESIENYGQTMEVAAKRLESIKAPSGRIDNLPTAKRIINKLAESLEAFAGTTETGAKQMQTSTSLSVKYIEGALNLSADFGPMDETDKEKLLQSVGEMIDATEHARGSLASFRASLDKTPRATIQFAKAKRKAVAALDNLDSTLESGNRVWNEIRALLRHSSN